MSLKITPAAYRQVELKITRIMVFISMTLYILDEKYPTRTLDGSVKRFGTLRSVK
jgi:hypothetical protein